MKFLLPFSITIQTNAATPGTASHATLTAEPASSLAHEIGKPAADVLESFLLAMAAEGIDLSDPKFSSALTTAAESIASNA